MIGRNITKYFGVRPALFVSAICDGLAMHFVFSIVFIFRFFLGNVDPYLYIWIAAMLCFGPIIMLILGSYETPIPPPHKLMQKTFLGISFTYLLILTILFLSQSTIDYSRSILFFSWAISVVTIPLLKSSMIKMFSIKNWWGTPVIFLQNKNKIESIWQELMDNPQRGLRPVDYLDVDEHTDFIEKLIDDKRKLYISPIFIWCTDNMQSIEKSTRFQKIVRHCRNVLIVSSKEKAVKKYWFAPRILGKSEAFLIRQNLSDSRRVRTKRYIDCILSCLALIISAPIFLILTVLIRLGSSGNALYKQKRIGQGGKIIYIYKFRTMVKNADEILQEHLKNNEAFKKEWEEDRKLRNDPRITKVGHFLRKTSLDELPQLFNVIKGEMSLVGPRPIVEAEIERYGDVYLEYTEVKPGITGLWQISGRNNTTYAQRVSYDQYYVAHWSVWLDIWIILKTIPTALMGDGAY